MRKGREIHPTKLGMSLLGAEPHVFQRETFICRVYHHRP